MRKQMDLLSSNQPTHQAEKVYHLQAWGLLKIQEWEMNQSVLQKLFNLDQFCLVCVAGYNHWEMVRKEPV